MRFWLLKKNYDDFYKFEENILKDIYFLNRLINYESSILWIQQKENSKKLQDLISKDIFEDIVKNSCQIIKNQICTIVYNKVVFDAKPSEKNSRYETYLKTATGKDLIDFIPDDYDFPDYTPEEHFYKAQKFGML